MPTKNDKILERRLTSLEVGQEGIKKDISEIKEQVFNFIPHKIDELENKFIIGLIIGVVSFIIVQTLSKLF